MLKAVIVEGHGPAGVGDVVEVSVDQATHHLGRCEAVEMDAETQPAKTRVLDVSGDTTETVEPVSLQTKRRGSRSRAQ